VTTLNGGGGNRAIFARLGVEQIDQSLGVIRGEEHRVHDTAVGSARIANREPAAFSSRTGAAARLQALCTKTVLQTASLEAAITIILGVETKVPLVDRQADSRLAAASTRHRNRSTTESALNATAVVHQSNSHTALSGNAIKARFGDFVIPNLSVIHLLFTPSAVHPSARSRGHQQIIVFVLNLNP